MNKKTYQYGAGILALLLALICIFPFVFVLAGSFWREGALSWQAYYDVFLASPQYLNRFWKSLGMCVCIALGQVAVSTLAGYGFAKYRFPGKNLIYFCLMILMILPLQVTLVPNYIMLDKLHMLGTEKALILPGIFLPLGTFLMTQCFKSLSDEVIDQARVDGCNLLETMIRIAVPMSRGALVCAGLLSFLDAWNMVEQPIAYLKEFAKYPLSVALAYVSPEQAVRQFVCCILVLLPPLALFSCFNKELVEGIVFGEEK